MTESLPTVIVVGAGFAGLRAARRLARRPLRVVLLDRQNHHLFQPLLYQVATAGLEPEQIAKPVRAIVRGLRRLEFRMVEVAGVDLAGRRVLTDAGSMDYDALILAPGAETDDFGLPGVRRHAFELKQAADGVALRNHILRCFERAVLEEDAARRQALLTLAVVGGGPTGVEMAGALAELTRLVLAKDYPGLAVDEVRIVLLEAAGRLLTGMPPRLSAVAAETLRAKGVEVRLDVAVAGYDGACVGLRSGERLAARTLIWAAGARAAGLASRLGLPQGRQGRVPVEDSLQVPGHPEVYLIGDAAYREEGGEPLPMMAPVALQMADCAADNLWRGRQGLPPRPFRYRNPGSLATIGRNAAVAALGGLHFTGFAAWVVWLVVHIIQLIGFRNRLFVLINWAVDYFFYDRAVRVIIGAARGVDGAPR